MQYNPIIYPISTEFLDHSDQISEKTHELLKEVAAEFCRISEKYSIERSNKIKIYHLEINIDGYGGHLKDRYFFDFNKAKEVILNQSAIMYIAEDNKWVIDGMKEVSVHEENNSFTLIGIPYPKEEQDEWCINYCKIYIRPIEINFDILNNSVWILKYNKGYCHWINNALNYNDFSEYNFNNQPSILGYYRSRKKARKAAKKKPWKEFPRSWIKHEDENKISPIGSGMNYLSIEKLNIE